jgi:hypothetical protein
VTEVEGMGRLRRRHKQLLNGHKEKRRLLNLKEKALVALCRELMEEPMDLSQDRQIMNNELRISAISTFYWKFFEMRACEMGRIHGMHGVKKKSYNMFGKPQF